MTGSFRRGYLRGTRARDAKSKELRRMPKASKRSAAKVVDHGPVEDRTAEFDGYTMNFVSIRQHMDLAPLLKGLPGDSCQCPHWGYMFKGKLTVRYADRDEIIEAGDAFYLPPGHVPVGEAGSEFVQFSPSDELQVSQAAMAKNMQQMQSA
jgi:quercetin dioxygenase-like cupin family protein